MLRTSIVPSLINVLAHNLHADLPIRIFEVGDTIIPSKGSRTETKRQMTLGAATMHSQAGFTETKSLLTTVLQELRVPKESWMVKPLQQEFFIPGRAAEVYLKNDRVGMIGETHPKILTDHQIEFPVSILELDLDTIYALK
jgi:phenylalanyl-tRNA synthetase beta chain